MLALFHLLVLLLHTRGTAVQLSVSPEKQPAALPSSNLRTVDLFFFSTPEHG
jgi:hypothetical protein